MMTEEENDQLTQVGPGTPMGDVLRHYWYPVAIVRELDEFPVKKRPGSSVRTGRCSRPASGGYGIVDERCPHRGASLVYGIVDDDGLRCGYHGWKFDTEGTCVDILAEPDSSPVFRAGCSVRAGEAQALGGVVWAYIGDGPGARAPPLRGLRHERDPRHRLVGPALQLAADHGERRRPVSRRGPPRELLRVHRRAAPASRCRARSGATSTRRWPSTTFEHGIIKRRLLVGQDEESDDWKIGHPLVFPYKMWVGGNGVFQMQIRIPVDDTTTPTCMFYTVHAPEGAELPEDPPCVDYEYEWIRDDGTYIVDYIEGQDIMAWVTQGAVADRTNEKLTKSDVGVVACRRMFKEAMEAVSDGRDPIAVVREPHDVIKLPLERSKFGRGAEFATEWIANGSMKYSPQAEALKTLHLDAEAARQRLTES